jgi:hypothetical protein
MQRAGVRRVRGSIATQDGEVCVVVSYRGADGMNWAVTKTINTDGTRVSLKTLN